MVDAASGIRVDVAGHVATITLDRPDALNALTIPMKHALLDALEGAAAAPDVRAVILTGAGRAFCAGQDLRERLEPAAPSLGEELRERYNPIVRAMRALPKPIVGAINGVAAGAGASIAFACDLRIASESTTFVLAFGRIGLIPDSGATWTLPRLVGLSKATEMALLNDPVTAAEALRFGLVSKVVAADALMDEARGLATRLTAGAPAANAATKRLLDAGMTSDLEAALAAETEAQDRLGGAPDHAEGLAAFLEKRAPTFRGE
ncbi:MAG TPA: enoyl-CoA hydratase-related protein [Candidatus Polarisedimenticolia bacterium]|nr:enoyl-CoA hydratase-related protein [Candidatus Polarisedimenticolia bacterium]